MIQNHNINWGLSRRPHRRAVACAVAILLLVSFLGCKEISAGKSVATTGAATANALASYYDSLAEDTIDVMEFEAFISSTRGVPYTETDQGALERQIEALKSRARMARSLAATYGAMTNLATYKADTGVTSAANDLGDALKGIKALPQSSVDPSQYIAQAATKLVELKQAKDIRQANELLLTSVSSLETLFARETEVYRSIAEERGNKVSDILGYLIQNDKVSAWPLLDRVPKALGLTWSGSQNATPDASTKKALIALATARERRHALVSANVADQLQQSLGELHKAHEELQANRSPVLGMVDDLVTKVRAGLDEIAGIRSGTDTAKGK